MLSKFRKWLGAGRTVEDTPPHGVAKRTPPGPATRNVRRQPSATAAVEDQASGDSESPGPGKHPPARRKFVREETGTHETLKILDDSIIESPQDDGADPYNTGGFDRSKSWDKRFSK